MRLTDSASSRRKGRALRCRPPGDGCGDIHQNRNLAEGRDGRFDDAGTVAGLSDIGRDGHRNPARLANGGRGALSGILADICNHHRCAFCRKSPRNGGADFPAPACNQRNTALKSPLAHMFLSLCLAELRLPFGRIITSHNNS